MSSGRHVRLPALRIPSEPPKFKFRKPKVIVKGAENNGPPPSTTSCDKTLNQESQAEPPKEQEINHQGLHLPPIHKEPADSKIPGLYGAYYSQCICDKKSNVDPLNELPPNKHGTVGKASATGIIGGSFEQPVKYKHFAYGSNDWLHLLVTGQLPPEVLQAFMSKFCRAGTTLKAHGPHAEKYFYYQERRKRTKQLWEPKEMKQQQVYSQFDRQQLEASCRQRKKMSELSKKAEMMVKRNESVLLKKVDMVDSRIKSYLDKMDKNCPKVSPDINTNENMRSSSCENDYISNNGDQKIKNVPKNPENIAVNILPVIAWAKAALSNMLSENCLSSGSSSPGNDKVD
ncbi:uncharacterized protein LOC132556117 [Ylistrum balloti]|uniref:uncharacterized protein LOC132556117 n=1 Tax=Ylistrum balloti TaxID=509963 RepID=UPI002905BE70|nr:uncharacterized protein LOC132556117 [Ylistrum balloti]